MLASTMAPRRLGARSGQEPAGEANVRALGIELRAELVERLPGLPQRTRRFVFTAAVGPVRIAARAGRGRRGDSLLERHFLAPLRVGHAADDLEAAALQHVEERATARAFGVAERLGRSTARHQQIDDRVIHAELRLEEALAIGLVAGDLIAPALERRDGAGIGIRCLVRASEAPQGVAERVPDSRFLADAPDARQRARRVMGGLERRLVALLIRAHARQLGQRRGERVFVVAIASKLCAAQEGVGGLVEPADAMEHGAVLIPRPRPQLARPRLLGVLDRAASRRERIVGALQREIRRREVRVLVDRAEAIAKALLQRNRALDVVDAEERRSLEHVDQPDVRDDIGEQLILVAMQRPSGFELDQRPSKIVTLQVDDGAVVVGDDGKARELAGGRERRRLVVVGERCVEVAVHPRQDAEVDDAADFTLPIAGLGEAHA